MGSRFFLASLRIHSLIHSLNSGTKNGVRVSGEQAKRDRGSWRDGRRMRGETQEAVEEERGRNLASASS